MTGLNRLVIIGLLLMLPGCTGCMNQTARTQRPEQEEKMLEPHPKFNADTVIFFARLEEGDNPMVSAAVRLNQTGNDLHREQLTDRGAAVQSMVGEIVTFQAPALSLYTIADLDFVVSVEIATPVQVIE